MAPNTTTSRIDEVMVVYLSGAIIFGEESASLRILVKDLLNKSRQIVLHLGDVTHIDSGSLGTLVALYASARKVGGDIKLANLGSRANEVLRITKLVAVFEVFNKAEDAIASFIAFRPREGIRWSTLYCINKRQEAKIRKGDEHGTTSNGSDHL